MRRVFTWFLACFALLGAAPALAHPGTGIVEDSKGNIYYTDLERVWRIAPDGARSVAVAGVHTHELYLDAGDNLYGEHTHYEGEATDRWSYRVWRRSPGGRIEDVVPPTEGFRTDYSFVRDASGNMYFTDADGYVVRKTPDGASARFSGRKFGDVRSMLASAEGVVHLIVGGDLWRIEKDGAAR